MSIIQMVNLGLDIFVGVILLLCLLGGFARGINKSTRRVISIVVPFILLVIFLGTIANAILEFDFSQFIEGDFTTVKAFAIDFISENVYTIEGMNIPETELYAFAEAVAVGVLKLAIYLVGVLLIYVIIAPLLRIILAIINSIIFPGKVKDPETGKKVKRKKTLASRLYGMLIGFGEFAVFFIVFLFPLFGTISIAKLGVDDLQQVMTVIDKIPGDDTTLVSENSGFDDVLITILKTNEDDLSDKTTEELFSEFNKQYKASAVRFILNITKSKKTELTVDSKYLGSLLTVKTKHGKLDFVEEYANLRRAIPIATSKFETNESNEMVFAFDKITDEDINIVCSVLKNIQLVKIALPVGYEYLCYMIENGEFAELEEIGVDVEAIKNIEINKELDTLIDVIGEVAKAATHLEIDLENPISVIEDPALVDSFDNIVQSLLKLQTVKEIAVPLAADKLVELLETVEDIDTTEIIPLITPETLLTALETDSTKLLVILQDVYAIGKDKLQDENAEIDLNSPENKQAIENIILNLFNVSLIKGHEEALLRTLLSLEMIKEYISVDDLFTGVEINWADEPQKIADIVLSVLPLINLKEMNFEQIISDKETIKNIVTNVAKSDLIRKAGIALLANLYESESTKEDSMIPEQLKSILNFDELKALTADEFANELINLVEIIYDLKEMDILFGEEGASIDLSNEEAITDIVERIFNVCVIKGNENEIIEFLLEEFELNAMLSEYGITLELNNIDWETEPANLAKVVTAIFNLGGGDISSIDFTTILEVNPETGERDQEMIKQIATVLDAFNNSQIFEPVIFDVIDVLISNVASDLEFDLSFTSVEKELIKTKGWETEINATLKVYDIATEKLLEAEDLTAIKGSDISEIMKEAGTSVIASKVLGTVLIEALGTNGYDKLPKNDDGTYKYDFTDPTILTEQADNIGNLIDLANTMTNLNTDTMGEAETVDQFVEELRKIEENELAKEVINEVASEYLGIEIDLSETDFNKEADVLSEVFDVYHEDPENFDISTNEELKEKIENSELAKSILEFLGLA